MTYPFSNFEWQSKKISLCLALFLLATIVCAQPSSWSFVPTNLSGVLLGTAQVNGSPAAPGDWIAAFDSDGNCAGAAEIIMNDGISYINLPIYGDDSSTPNVDEGMSGSEGFQLQLYRIESEAILNYPESSSPQVFDEWANTNGAPIPAYSDPLQSYNFLDTQVINLNCPESSVCETNEEFAMSAWPEGGSWTGLWVSPEGVFNPAAAGAGTHVVDYAFGDETASCEIVVDAQPDATILTTGPFCPEQGPVPLEAASMGGVWAGTAVFSGQFDPSFADTGVFEITYSISNESCFASDTTTVTVFPTAPQPVIEQVGDFLVVSWEGSAALDISWLNFTTGETLLGETGATITDLEDGILYAATLTTAFGCSATSNPILYLPVGVSEHSNHTLWLGPHGVLEPQGQLVDATWFDLAGRKLGNGCTLPSDAGTYVLVRAVQLSGETIQLILPTTP